MQKKLLFREATVPKSEENMHAFTLEYYMVTTKLQHNGTAHETYGIEIIKRYKSDLFQSESKMIEDIFTSREKIRGMLEILYKNLVTPVTFIDVAQDMMAYDSDIFITKMGA